MNPVPLWGRQGLGEVSQKEKAALRTGKGVGECPGDLPSSPALKTGAWEPLPSWGPRAQLWASQPEQLGYGLGASSIGMGRIFSQKGSWKARWSGGRAAQRSLRRPRGTLLFENPMNSEFLSLLRSNLCFYDPEDTQQTNYLLGHW